MTSASLFVGLFLILHVSTCLAGTVAHLRVGAILSESGDKASVMIQARMGYEFTAAKYNDAAGGLAIGGRSLFLNFTSLDDGSDETRHAQQLKAMLEDGVQLVMGSDPKFAFEETAQVAAAGALSMQCCVGPDPVYEQGFETVFGVQTSNTARHDSAEPFFRLNAPLFTATAWILIPAYCFAIP